MKRKNVLTLLIAVLAASLCALFVTACRDGYQHNREIPGIQENAVLHIENNSLSFAKDMEIEAVDIISRCDCMLVNDDGSQVKITKQHLVDGAVTYDNFDLSSTGTGKQIKVAYKNAVNYIMYDVREYTVNYYLGEGKTSLWKSEPASAALTDELRLSVWIDIAANNYSVDGRAVTEDSDRATRFNGWYDEQDNSVTGLTSLSAPANGDTRVTDLHAHYLTAQQAAEMSISYQNGRRVFSGYSGGDIETLVIPEGVTYVDLAAMFPASPSATQLKFSKLRLPSTATADLPFRTGINTAGLTDISVDGGNAVYSSYNGALYSKDYSELYLMPANSLNVSFHDNITAFGSYSCAYWQITTLGVPETVNTFKDFCFAYSSLLTVDGCENVKNIMRGVFLGTALSIDDDGVALYTVSSGEGANAKYSLSMIIDKSITEFTVKSGTVSIAGDAFYNCKNLVSVNLGGEVEEIGDSAFRGCSALAEITLPATLQRLGSAVFYECKALAAVNGLGDVSFSQQRMVIEHTLPNSLFYGCESLSSLTLPQGLQHIGSSTFRGCSALTALAIPSTVVTIGDYAFYDCGVTSLTLPAALESLGRGTFSHSDLTSVNLSACTKLTELPLRCFEYTKVVSIQIPAGITEIPDYCFYYNRSLEEISLGNVTAIGERAFGYCTKLTTIEWNKVQTVGARAFVSCTALKEFTIPDSVVTISAYAFQSCTGLEKLTIGAGLTSFGGYTFTSDGKNFDVASPALYLCNNLKEITVSERNTVFSSVDGVLYGQTVAGRNFGGGGVLYAVPCGYESSSLTLPVTVRVILPYSVHNQQNLTGIILNSGLENIGKGAFYNSKNLEALNIPSTVTTLGANVLLNCTGVTSFTIDENNKTYSTDGNLIYGDDGKNLIMYVGLSEQVEIRQGTLSVAMGVFMNNAKITSLVIPDSVTEIGEKSFDGCTGLKSIQIGSGLNKIDPTSFAALSALESITVSADNPNFKAVNNVLYSKDGKTLYLCAAKNGMTTLDIEEGVTQIGDWAFSYHATLSGVKLPSTVETVGEYAFYECRNLVYFHGSEMLRTVGRYAFAFATSVTPDDNTETRFNDALKEVLLYENTRSVGDYAFYGQYGLERVFFKMTGDEADAFVRASGKNITYLTRGCPKGDTGEHYNNVSCYLYLATEPNDFTIDHGNYGWFRFDQNNQPKPW